MAFLLDRNSKADTRFFADRAGGGAVDLATDISQWRTNLTNSTTYLTSTDARLAVRAPREITVVVDLSTGDDRIILNWGNVAGTSYIYRIFINSGAPTFGHNNADLVTVNPPNLSGSPKSYLLHWSTDYDIRAATFYSELAVCDIGANAWTITRVTHTQPQAPAGGDQFNILGYGAGVTKFTAGLAAIDFVRVGCRFHTTTEAKEDWVAQSSAPSVTGVQLEVELAPSAPTFFSADPVDPVADAMLDEATLAGPAEFAAVVNAAAGRKRLYSPIVNLAPRATPTLDNTYTPAKLYRQVGVAGRYAAAQYVFARPRDAYLADKARVRVHVQAWIAGGAPGGTAVSIDLAAWSDAALNNPDAIVGTVLTITDNHTSTGVGQWYDLGDMFVVGVAGFIGIAWKFGTGTGASYLRMKIKAVSIEPFEG